MLVVIHTFGSESINLLLDMNLIRMDKNQFTVLLAVESEVFYNYLLKITVSWSMQ